MFRRRRPARDVDVSGVRRVSPPYARDALSGPGARGPARKVTAGVRGSTGSVRAPPGVPSRRPSAPPPPRTAGVRWIDARFAPAPGVQQGGDEAAADGGPIPPHIPRRPWWTTPRHQGRRRCRPCSRAAGHGARRGSLQRADSRPLPDTGIGRSEPCRSPRPARLLRPQVLSARPRRQRLRLDRRRGRVLRRARRLRGRRRQLHRHRRRLLRLGARQQGGESETVIGNWLAARGNRDRRRHRHQGRRRTPTSRGSRPPPSRRAAEESLRRLRTDYIDLYYTHFDDRPSRSRRSSPPSTSWSRRARSARSPPPTSRAERLPRRSLDFSEREGLRPLRRPPAALQPRLPRHLRGRLGRRSPPRTAWPPSRTSRWPPASSPASTGRARRSRARAPRARPSTWRPSAAGRCSPRSTRSPRRTTPRSPRSPWPGWPPGRRSRRRSPAPAPWSSSRPARRRRPRVDGRGGRPADGGVRLTERGAARLSPGPGRALVPAGGGRGRQGRCRRTGVTRPGPAVRAAAPGRRGPTPAPRP